MALDELDPLEFLLNARHMEVRFGVRVPRGIPDVASVLGRVVLDGEGLWVQGHAKLAEGIGGGCTVLVGKGSLHRLV